MLATTEREAARIAALIKRNGTAHTFTRYKANKYKEATAEVDVTYSILGIFHTSSGFVTRTKGDSATQRNSPQPMILMSYVAPELQPKKDDQVTIGNETFRVTALNNIEGGNFALDISLELIVNG